MSKKTLTQVVHAACDAGDALQAASLDLIEIAKGMTYVDFRNAVAKAIGTKYTVKPHKSQLNKGWLTFAKDSAPYQKLKALVQCHAGHQRGKPEVVVVPASLRRNIVDAIIASGINSKQFNALLREVRESVTFK